MEALNGSLADAAAGRGRLLLLAGEAGIGKTRLAEELATEAQRGGARVLWGRCIEGESAPAFWPWVQLVRSLLRTCGDAAVVSALGSGAADLAHLVPEVRERVPGLAPSPTVDSEQARFRMFESVAALLRNAAANTPLVVVLEDLHWADKPSLLLLELVAGELTDAHVLVLGTYCDTEVRRQHPLAEMLGRLARGPCTERILLRGLEEQDVARLIELIANEKPSSSLVAAVHQQTEGNPLFIRELVMLLATDGRLPAGHLGTWSLAVPQGVREVIGRRLNGLSSRCNHLLSAASVIGREFDLHVLGAIGDVSSDALLELLDEALEGRVLVELRSVGRWAFAHALIRETLYEELRSVRRAELHRRVANALERAYAPDVEPHLPELAFHFCAAAQLGGEVGKAIDYATRAGIHAVEQLAYEEASAHYGRALELLQLEVPTDPRRSLELTVALGDAQVKAGEAAGGRKTFVRAAELARRCGAPEQLARAALGLGSSLPEAPGWSDVISPRPVQLGTPRRYAPDGRQTRAFWGYGTGLVDEELIALLEESLAVLDPRDSAPRALVLARLAVALYWSTSATRRGRIRTLAAEAVAMAHRLEDPTVELIALASRHWADWRPDNVDERHEAAGAIARLGTQLGNRELAILGQAFVLADGLEVGDLPTVEHALEAFARLAEELRQPRHFWWLTMFRGMLALLAGRFAEDARLVGEALAIGQTQASDTAQAVGVHMIIVRRDCGGLEELLATSTQLAAQYPAVRTWQYTLALLEAEVGREDSARQRLDALATHAFADLAQDLTWLTTVAVASEAAALLGDRARSAALYDLLLPYAGRCVVVGYGLACLGSVARYLGLLATTLARWTDAERHLQAALEVNERLGARPLVARTQYDLARLLAARAGPGDRQEACRQVARALATAHDLGMTRLADGLRRLEAALAGEGDVAEPLPPAPPIQPSSEPPLENENVFHLEGDFWTLRYAGTLLRLKDAKGLRYIAHLLRHPGREFHVADLVAVINPEGGELARSSTGEHAGPILDPRAKVEYQQRLDELRAELDQATAWADRGRAARLRDEIEFLTQELASAYGFGGRARMAADATERVRKAVTGRVRDSIARIQKESPALALHLGNAIRLGTFCAYTPERLPPWNLS